MPIYAYFVIAALSTLLLFWVLSLLYVGAKSDEWTIVEEDRKP